MDQWKALLKAGNEIEKITKWKIRMEAPDDVKLSHRFAIARGRRFERLFERHRVSAGTVLLPPKRAQPASSDANVCWIDVAVDVEVSYIAMQAFADVVRQPADCENVARVVQSKRVLSREPFVSQHFGMNRSEAWVVRLKAM